MPDRGHARLRSSFGSLARGKQAACPRCHRALRRLSDIAVFPDPPSKTIDLLRSENVRVIYGNNEAYLRDWGTPRWESTVAARRRRPDSPDYFLPLIERGQAELTSAELAWLRALPADLSLDGAREGDAYVCHGMLGNPFATPWDTDPAYTPAFADHEIRAALSRDGVASADLILCGHCPGPRCFASRCQMDERRWSFAAPDACLATGQGRGTTGSVCFRIAADR